VKKIHFLKVFATFPREKTRGNNWFESLVRLSRYSSHTATLLDSGKVRIVIVGDEHIDIN